MAVGSIPKRGRSRVRPLMKGAALAILVAGAVAAAADVSLTVERREGAYQVRGRFETSAQQDLVWAVLTDYERIPAFVRSMRESRIESRKGARLQVRQEAVVGTFPLRKKAHLLLDVQERGTERIEFRDLLDEDFRLYVGAWDVFGDSTGTRVAYSLDAEPKGMVPPWIGRSMMKSGATDLLEQVRAEIERRASGAPAH